MALRGNPDSTFHSAILWMQLHATLLRIAATAIRHETKARGGNNLMTEETRKFVDIAAVSVNIAARWFAEQVRPSSSS
jgi:hypothetical protein